MPINIGDEVKLHYTAKLENGEVIETTRGREPLSFKVGSKRLLTGLEEALIGLEKGDKKEVEVPPDKGFGERREDLYQEIPKSMFKGEFTLSEGMPVEFKFEKELPRLVTIHEIKKNSVVLDLNHPLAGQTLKFDVEIVDDSSRKKGISRSQ